LYTEQY